MTPLFCRWLEVDAVSPLRVLDRLAKEGISVYGVRKCSPVRLKIRVKGENGKNYLPHTLNNTVVAPPRMLIAFLENNLEADGSVKIPAALRPYMGGKEKILPKH